MSRFIFITLVFAFPLCSYGGDSFESLISQLEQKSKGPFGLNYLQGTKSRTTVRSGRHPSGKFLFQAAYRNEVAEKLAKEYEFYTGNLFTANYYQLLGEFHYGVESGSYALNHQGLKEVGASAMSKTVAIVKDWVLEKYFISTYPESRIAKGFAKRGIGGSEFEQEYAVYFFDFYLSVLEDDYHYLPAYLLAKQSPITNSRVLNEVRKKITESYDYFAAKYGTSDRRVKGLYTIRNAIHNQLSESVLILIETYLEENPWYEAKGNTYLQKIHRQLSDYFNMGADEIETVAKALTLSDVKDAARAIVAGGTTLENLYRLSLSAVDIKKQLGSEGRVQEKAETLALITNISQFLSKELIRKGRLQSRLQAEILLNVIFLEGFLIFDNWQYYVGELNHLNLQESRAMLAEVADVATMTLEEVMYRDLQQWLRISPDKKMEHFIDDTLKSSSLNTLSIIIQ